MICDYTLSEFKKAAKLLSLPIGIFFLLAVLTLTFSGCLRKSVSLPSSSPQGTPREDFLTKSRSRIQVLFPSLGQTTIYLFAPDEKQGTIEYPYCGGGLGAKTYEGNYQLIMTQGLKILNRLSLGELSFVEDYPFDGQLRLEALRLKEGQTNFITLFQYISCNMNEALVFGYSEELGLFKVPFVRRDGREVAVYVDPGKTRLLANTSDRFLTRFYDNSLGKFRVTEWVFDFAKREFKEKSYWEE